MFATPRLPPRVCLARTPRRPPRSQHTIVLPKPIEMGKIVEGLPTLEPMTVNLYAA